MKVRCAQRWLTCREKTTVLSLGSFSERNTSYLSRAMQSNAVLVLIFLAAAAQGEQGRQFPTGSIVDPQLYDRPDYNEGPLDRPPVYGGRPPFDRPPYYGDGPYDGRPPFEGGNRDPYDGRPPYEGGNRDPYDENRQGPYQTNRPYPRPYRPTPPPPPPGYRPQYPPPGYNQQGAAGFGGVNPMASFTNAIDSIAKYDDKQCVARMLCELSAGGRPGSGYRGSGGGFFDLSGLQGLADLLGAMTASPAASPMFTFGRAALLGATMRDPYRCYRSFPNCPRDPDRLVDYLNNHNGGFFRLFEPPTSTEGYYPTKRPYYNRKGKKITDQSDQKEQRESEGTESNSVNPRIINDNPLIADRTGTGDLRLDREQLESPASGGNSPRGARNLRFPPANNNPVDSRPDAKQLTFPKE